MRVPRFMLQVMTSPDYPTMQGKLDSGHSHKALESQEFDFRVMLRLKFIDPLSQREVTFLVGARV